METVIILPSISLILSVGLYIVDFSSDLKQAIISRRLLQLNFIGKQIRPNEYCNTTRNKDEECIRN